MKEYLIAFLNGFLSFASPCIVPLIPGYLSLISGVSAKDIMEGRDIERKRIFLFSLFFILGFSVVFSLLGAFSSLAGSFLIKNRIVFERISGALIFLLGIHISGVVRLSFLDYEKRKVFKGLTPNYLTAFITGMSFAFGWSPCIGPFLATTLTIAANKPIIEGTTLLLTYSFGMGVPLLVISLFGGFLFKWLFSKKLIALWTERLAGLLMAFFGVLIFLGRFSLA